MTFYFYFLTTPFISNREIKNNWKRVRLQANFLKFVKIWIEIFTACQNMIQPSSPVSFSMEVFTIQTLEQNSFHKESLLEKEHIFFQDFREKLWFWNKLSERFRMRIKTFKTCQFLKLKTSNAWDFEGKHFHEIIVWGKLCFSKSIFCIILHCKKVKFCIFVPWWKTWKEEKRIRKTNSNKIFKSSSDFESAFLYGLQFWNEKLKTWPSSSQLLTTRQILNWFFYSVLDFD